MAAKTKVKATGVAVCSVMIVTGVVLLLADVVAARYMLPLIGAGAGALIGTLLRRNKT